jgi:hypothetical protein
MRIASSSAVSLACSAIRSAATRELAQFAHAFRQLTFIGNEDGQTLLDGKADGATRADELLLIASESGFALGIERAAELREKGVIHGSSGAESRWTSEEVYRQ